ncbi:MAG TPA: RDD family protein [Puia sp.]|nr:RDD family protein [Puia sp.]
MYRYRYETFGSRFLAAIIDGLLLRLVSQYLISTLKLDYDNDTFALVIRVALFYSYSILLHYRFGQTLGKKIAKVIVVSNSDESQLINLWNAFKRDSVGIFFSGLALLAKVYDIHNSFTVALIGYSISAWMWAELITLFFNNKMRAIHDFLGNSVVIDSRVFVPASPSSNSSAD